MTATTLDAMPPTLPYAGCPGKVLSRIIVRMEHGEEVVIVRGDTPVGKVSPLNRSVERTDRGSLRDRLVVTDDWDSPEVNKSIARDFGLHS
jgi:antitoxin (DNA-binding transcriptional repressor) of toxin-antitoxin stability system